MKNKKRINKEMGMVKKLFKGIIKIFGMAVFTLIKNLLYIIYVLIYNFNNLVAKVYMKLPRLVKVGCIYILIALSIMNFLGCGKIKMNSNDNIVQNSSEMALLDELEQKEYNYIPNKENVQEEPKNAKNEDIEKEQENKCNLKSEIECKIYNKGIEKGMTHKQALLVVAISRHETGNWTSNAFKTKNNFGGIMKNGKLATYETQDAGLERFINLLNDKYFAKGLDTIKEIQKVYAPIGAKNDPNNLNSHWVNGVTKFYNEYLNLK